VGLGLALLSSLGAASLCARAEDAATSPPPAPALPAAEEPVGEIVVYGEQSLKETETHAVQTISASELEEAGGDDLGETLSAVPGVTSARGNSDSTKPIIRGQLERRLLVLFDGVRHESQKWGLDHTTEIDPFAAGELHVIKGAAGVRYGPDAIGGVILVDPPPMRSEPGAGGRAQGVGVSNGPRGVAAARVDAASESVPGLSLRLEGNYAVGAAVHTPDYMLGNTGSREWNAGISLGYTRGDSRLVVAMHHFDLQAGVCYCLRSVTPEEFTAGLDRTTPIGADRWTPTAEIDRPYQAVTHDLAMVRLDHALDGGGDLRLTYAFQLNLRQEYDQTRASITGPQYDFTLRSHSVDSAFNHRPHSVGAAGLVDGGLGLSLVAQQNVYAGLPLIPNFSALQGGVFGVERWTAGALAVEAGARYDHLSRTAYLTPSAFSRSVSRETLSPDDCTLTAAAAACPSSDDAGSLSLGALWHIAPDTLEARLDLSSATRFPNADELYMNGSAPTSPVYALGSPGLGPETTWGASPTLGLRAAWLEAEASTYANYIDDYVYFAPELGADGAPRVDVTIQGSFPRFSFRPIDALFYGADGGLTLGPERLLQLRLQGAVVRGIDTETGPS
jgi:iron complex outermembrane receptor protein